MGVVQIRAHHDPAAFRVLVTPLLAADRVRHTVFLTVLAALCRAPSPSTGCGHPTGCLVPCGACATTTRRW